MHKYLVSLSIVADELDESELSRILDVKPSSFRQRGDLRSPTSRYERSAWLRHFDPPNGEPHWSSLNEGLKQMAEQLRPRKAALLEVGKKHDIAAYCGHFGSGFGGGPDIAPETLRELAELGLSLSIDTYWSSLEPDE